jgi:hypothetical protein
MKSSCKKATSSCSEFAALRSGLVIKRIIARTWPSPGVSISSATVENEIIPPTSGCPLTYLAPELSA